MNRDLEIPFDQVTYREGQKLTARDLEDDRLRRDRMRRLHVRLQHYTWGIALGLKVIKTDENRMIQVWPGYAVDDRGNDILLYETIQLPVPVVQGPENHVLTLNYQEDAVFRARLQQMHSRMETGLDPHLERPGFKWRRPDDVRFGPQVPLVQVTVANGEIQGELDTRVRRNARPDIKPYMGWGVTETGRSGWRIWQEGDQTDLGLELDVDTSEAGFIENPMYFAMLQGDLFDAAGVDQPSVLMTDGMGFITDSRRDRFTYRIVSTDQPSLGTTPSAGEAEQRGWTLFWIGLEPVGGCEPQHTPYLTFFLSGITSAFTTLQI